jgi:hypothetical protein
MLLVLPACVTPGLGENATRLDVLHRQALFAPGRLSQAATVQAGGG